MREHIKPAFVSFSNYMRTTGSHVRQRRSRFNPEIRQLIAFQQLRELYRFALSPLNKKTVLSLTCFLQN